MKKITTTTTTTTKKTQGDKINNIITGQTRNVFHPNDDRSDT